MDSHIAPHIVEPVRIRRNLQTPALIPHHIVVGDPPFFLYGENLGEVFVQTHRTNAVPGSAAAMSVIPASANSLSNRSCTVRKTGSKQPRASGEYPGTSVIPNCCNTRCTYVSRFLSTLPPDFSVYR